MAPELCTEAGLTLDEVVEAMLAGFARGSAGTDLTIYAICSAMRTAARSREIAELAVRWRDAGVVGFDIAGAEAGLPAHPPPRCVPVRAARELPLHHPRRRGVRPAAASGRPCSSAAPSDSATACASSTTSPGTPGDEQLGRLAVVHPRPADPARAVPDVERRHRRVRIDRRAPDRHAAPPALPGHGQHRQPADERHVDDATR